MYEEVHEERRVYRYVNRLVGAEQKKSRGIVTKVGSAKPAPVLGAVGGASLIFLQKCAW